MVWAKEDAMRVGFIGVGNMGAPLAGFVLKAGFPLAVHDIRREAAATLLEQGAIWADSPAEGAARCDVICTCVPRPPEMQAGAARGRGGPGGAETGAGAVDPTTDAP